MCCAAALQAKHAATSPTVVSEKGPTLLNLSVWHGGDARRGGIATRAWSDWNTVQRPVAHRGGRGWAGRGCHVAQAVVEEVKLGARCMNARQQAGCRTGALPIAWSRRWCGPGVVRAAASRCASRLRTNAIVTPMELPYDCCRRGRWMHRSLSLRSSG